MPIHLGIIKKGREDLPPSPVQNHDSKVEISKSSTLFLINLFVITHTKEGQQKR
jgi:hypothetical protein